MCTIAPVAIQQLPSFLCPVYRQLPFLMLSTILPMQHFLALFSMKYFPKTASKSFVHVCMNVCQFVDSGTHVHVNMCV